MATSFDKTDQSLRAEHGLFSRSMLLGGLALFAIWMMWAFSFRVTRYEVSDTARLEVAGAAVPVQMSVAGRVSASHLTLGKAVEAGSVLIELDDREQRLALRQEQTHRTEFEPQLSALRLQLQAETAGRAGEEQVLGYSSRGARAQVSRARSEADLAARQAQRATRLRAEGLISDADAQKATGLADSLQAAVEGFEQAELRLSPELTVRNNDRLLKQREILTAVAKLQADIASSNSTLARLRYELEQRRVRAPISGKLTECDVLHAGAYLREGQRVGVILPPGKVQAIADFTPAAALGKVQPGERATVRLNGFPWAQFGVLRATVSKVAGEIRDGKVRVEFDVNRDSQTRIPLQHGLPGSVEVEVEQITPAALLLRSAGRTIGAH